jgi:hypothetical protein
VTYSKRMDEKGLEARQRLKKILEKKNKTDVQATPAKTDDPTRVTKSGDNKENDDVEVTTVDVVVKTKDGQE